MNSVYYQEYLKKQAVKNDSMCRRCGVCCGAGNDPCINLVRDKGELYRCLIYDNRLGPQRTVSGSFFTCVPIRDNIRSGFSRPGCGYIEPVSSA